MSGVETKALTAIERFRVLALTCCPEGAGLHLGHVAVAQLLEEIDALRHRVAHPGAGVTQPQLEAAVGGANSVLDQARALSADASAVLEIGKARLAEAEDVRFQAIAMGQKVQARWQQVERCAVALLCAGIIQFGVILWHAL